MSAVDDLERMSADELAEDRARCAEERSRLAEERTRLAEERTQASEHRSILANERTFSAWLRTGMSALAVGIGAAELLRGSEQRAVALVLGIILIALGGLLPVIGARRYLNTAQKLEGEDAGPTPRWVVEGTAAALLFAAILAMVIVLMR